MTQLPKTSELCRRPEFRLMSRYLRSVRPEYPVFPVLPPSLFRTLASQDEHDPDFAGPPAYDSIAPASRTDAAPSHHQPLEGVHLEVMACVWMLSRVSRSP